MKIKTDYEHSKSFTAGKEYEVMYYKESYNIRYATIIDNLGHAALAFIGEPCPSLDNSGTWEIVEEK